MKVKMMPMRNIDLEVEEEFMNTMLNRGYILKNKFLFFYMFDHIEKDISTGKVYTIELIQDIYLKELQTSQTILYERRTNIKGLKRIYYLSPKDNTITHDLNLYMKYYKKCLNTISIYSIIAMIPVPLCYVLLIAKIKVPSVILVMSLLLLVSCIYVHIKTRALDNKYTGLAQDEGFSVDLNPHYVITFNKSVTINQERISDVLKVLGILTKYSNESDSYRLQSSLGKDELIAEISESLNISKDEFRVIGVGDLNFMI